MSMEETARKKLWELKLQHHTWEGVARHLSEKSDMPISKTAVWKMAEKGSRSIRIMKMLGLMKKRYRRSAEFDSEARVHQWDCFLEQHHISLSQLCNDLLDGKVSIDFHSSE